VRAWLGVGTCSCPSFLRFTCRYFLDLDFVERRLLIERCATVCKRYELFVLFVSRLNRNHATVKSVCAFMVEFYRTGANVSVQG
jgi:hypothetical protein